MPAVLLDTNFLIYCAKYKLFDQLKGFRLIVLSPILKELEWLAEERGKEGAEARLALSILEAMTKRREVILKEAEGSADAAILRTAMQLKCAVATLDRILARKLKAKRVGILKIRQKKRLIPA